MSGMFSHWAEDLTPSPHFGGFKPSKPLGGFHDDTQVGHAAFHPYHDIEDIKERLKKLEKAEKRMPIANKYVISKSIQVGKHLVLLLVYPNCTNHEGKKILVFKNINLKDLLERNNKLIDPHFIDNPNFVSPFCRFDPTEEGLECAIQFAKQIL
jgi:hypothetical protein